MRKNDITKFIEMNAYLNEGIVPLDELHKDVNRLLADVPTEEAHRMKRKFRKLWRKLAKEMAKKNQERAKSIYGLGQQDQTRRQRTARKSSVSSSIMFSKVLPQLKKLSDE